MRSEQPTITFWGVRGSVPTPCASHLYYGGNTTCIEVAIGGHRLIFDSGTGIRACGRAMLQEGVRDYTIFLTHTHWDHINGFPFFKPAFDSTCSLEIMAGHLRPPLTIQEVLGGQMLMPYFPVQLNQLRSRIRYRDLRGESDFLFRDTVRVRTCALNHPGGALGYRIEHGGRSVSLIFDTEHPEQGLDSNVLGLVDGCDMMVYDSMYTEAEYAHRRGWGHSTPRQGVRIAREAKVGNLVLFHLNPEYDDATIHGILRETQDSFAHTLAAREGLTLAF